ncbi:polymorphic toxin type 46 domain-containing protein [Pseudomonas putida]|uniref:polymorphic toxin type 46 domain-containing protein n=1 Tax=Pseudomonas putida TaxID=303 RepID=UPI002ED546C5|nr:polymorphic toxin type 46 domain-containing protein [Pseudomonas putida]
MLERATWQDTNIRGNQDTAANFFKSQGYKSADYIPCSLSLCMITGKKLRD